MSAAILSRPTKSGCNWNAFGNPVIFKLQRQDHAFDQIQDNAGFVRLRINGTDVTSYYQVGNTVYYDGAIFATSATITASAFSGGHTLITVNVAYVSTDAGIINNLSKRTDYRLEYNFKSIAGTELLAADLTISPNSEGIMLLNASLLKNLLSATWTEPTGFAVINVFDSDGSIGFYLSYQEYYDGALQGSVTNDSGNHIYGLLGANQIGSADGSNMLAYFPTAEDDTKKWLTRFQLNDTLKGLRMWRDWPFTLSVIHTDGFDLWMYRTQYNAAGSSILGGGLVELDHTKDGALNRIRVIDPDVFPLNTSTKTIKLQLATKVQVLDDPSFDVGIGGDWSNVVQGTPNNPWINSTPGTIGVALDNPGTPVLYSQLAFQTLNETFPAGNYVVRINGYQSGSGITNTVIQLFTGGVPNAGPPAYDSSSTQYPSTAGDVEFSFTAFDPFNGIGLGIRRVVGVDTRTIFYNDAELLVTVMASEELEIEVADACDYDEDRLPIAGQNPIMLQWKNSIGGDAQWLFPYYHEYNYSTRGGRKAKRIILFDQDLNATQWEAISELISTNEIYSPAIVDLENTNTVNATSKQVGRQVYMIDQDGNKTGVIVIPSSERINARDIGHRIAIEIELPEFQEA